MTKKGIAVPYIIALILGIIVVGLIGYWLFTTPPPGPAAECNTKAAQWCSEWAGTGFRISPDAVFGEWDTFAAGCSNIGYPEPQERACRAQTGNLLRTGAACTDDGECESNTCDARTNTCT